MSSPLECSKRNERGGNSPARSPVLHQRSSLTSPGLIPCQQEPTTDVQLPTPRTGRLQCCETTTLSYNIPYNFRFHLVRLPGFLDQNSWNETRTENAHTVQSIVTMPLQQTLENCPHRSRELLTEEWKTRVVLEGDREGNERTRRT